MIAYLRSSQNDAKTTINFDKIANDRFSIICDLGRNFAQICDKTTQIFQRSDHDKIANDQQGFDCGSQKCDMTHFIHKVTIFLIARVRSLIDSDRKCEWGNRKNAIRRKIVANMLADRTRAWIVDIYRKIASSVRTFAI